MTYKELIVQLHQTEPQPNPEYYKTLIDNAEVIVLQTALSKSHTVAKDLGISTPKFSIILSILKEYANGNK